MAQTSAERLSIRLFPWRGGLATAGQQASIPEDMLWQAKNVGFALDGMMEKRPGTKQWGQTIRIPDIGATGSTLTTIADFLNGTSDFTHTDSSNTLISYDTLQTGVLATNVKAGTALGTDNYTMSHDVSGQSLGEDWSLRFMVKVTNAPAYTAAGTSTNTFAFRVQAANNTGKEFAIWSGGLYYKLDSTGAYQLVSGTEKAGTGAWTEIEVRGDDASGGETNVYLDGVLITTTAITSSTMADVALTGTSDYEFYWQIKGTGAIGTAYNTRIVMPMYNDASVAPFKAVPISALKDFHYTSPSNASRVANVLAAGNYIYADAGQAGVWRPLKARAYQDTFFIDYRQTLVWIEHDNATQSSMWQWTGGQTAPTELKDAPPCQFGTSHQGRIIVAGDPANPLRAYVCADRQPNVWFSPSPTNIEDQFDVAIDAGYFEVPSDRGDRVTAAFGEFHDEALLWTKHGTYHISGYGPRSWQLKRIAGVNVGCEGEHAVTQVANDVWYISNRGVQSISATDKFGGLESQFPSGPIQDLFSEDPGAVNKVASQHLRKAKLEYDARRSLVYIALPLSGTTDTKALYLYHTTTQGLRGPLTLDTRAMTAFEIDAPRKEFIVHGGSDGIVRYMSSNTVKSDVGSAAIEMVVQTAKLNGRSIDPQIVTMDKTWKRAWLLVPVRGDWNFTVAFAADTSRTKTVSQNPGGKNRQFVLDEDFRLDVNQLGTREQVVRIPVDISLQGPDIDITITDNTAGQDLALQGLEVEFTVAGYEGT